MEFDALVESFLNESPFDSVSQIQSKKFTRNHPAKAKFGIGDTVVLRKLDQNPSISNRHPAFRRYGPGAEGVIVGMQKNTGSMTQGGKINIGHGRAVYTRPHKMINAMNRYYVKFPDGKIYPISSMYLSSFVNSL